LVDEPARQLAQLAPTPVLALLYWPAGQLTHWSRVADEYWPAAHAVHCGEAVVAAT
jgi:hypothetical protein